MERRIFAFTGGETTLYRGGLKRMAQLAKEAGDNTLIGIDTNGWLISQHEDYLDAWEGLQDVMSFYVSVKEVEAKEFQRFTGVDQKYCDTHFTAIERLLKRGFFAIPGGIVLNTLADEESLCNKPNPIELLHRKLSAIHPSLPKVIASHKISMLVHDQKQLSMKMKSRGYCRTKPALVKEALVKLFEERGTAIIEDLPENRGAPGIVCKKKVLERIISSI